jgi:hypothetical protein
MHRVVLGSSTKMGLRVKTHSENCMYRARQDIYDLAVSSQRPRRNTNGEGAELNENKQQGYLSPTRLEAENQPAQDHQGCRS